ncbi:peptide chain release factor 1 [Candidatus Shapirobacteria bacterium CG10_big_fil_rev_8_21_14_0_10_38_8]|nr:MAG: peptide chain release factor 1 [Candidatus Shapirobacteria bacterium CG10_big_fil_rev_8_21_14_0_10_38_8]
MIEARPGTGGDEAKIWADDLLRMYTRYANSQGWKVFDIDDGVIKIQGTNAFVLLQHESGVHRVQRVPQTERYGRIHTSTATVAVLPEISEQEIQINPADIAWEFYRASSHGGQNVQKVSTAVRLRHIPSGIVVQAQQERFQERNRELAMAILRSKLWEKSELEKETTQAGYRSPIGRGMRAEKIRTYNYAQNRVTDHRLNKSWHNLDKIIEGNLQPILSLLQSSSL